ncbi:uncharacterized protein UHOD_12297 [Ustilago sp. UG-2017b]|nr:uncharacterized protein UHOD_12297 [Ustilago sp. UG-2017b]
MLLKAFAQCRLRHCFLSLLSLCRPVDLFDTAPPPHGLCAGVLDTALLLLTGDDSPDPLSYEPLSGNPLRASELGPLIGNAWSCSSHVKFVALSSLPLISAGSATRSCLLQILAGFVIPLSLVPI